MLLWSWRGAEYLTAIVKASFRWQNGSTMLLAEPEPLALADRPHDGNPALSLRLANDRVPGRPEVDVLMTATAFGAGGQPASSTAVRLGVYRTTEPLIDKTLHVFGDRFRDDDGRATEPEPFESLKLRYDRAERDGDNPHGVRGRKMPNNVYPGRPGRSAGFGPLSPFARSRNRHLGGAKPRSLEAARLQLADDLDWQYFQSAPEDQRLRSLRGDEQIVLDGVHATLTSQRSQLPGARAEAYLGAGTPDARASLAEADPSGWLALPLTADTLVIDADAGLVSIVWRGHFRLSPEHGLSEMILATGVTLPGETLQLTPAAELYAQTDSCPPPSEEANSTTLAEAGAETMAIGEHWRNSVSEAPFPLSEPRDSGTISVPPATPLPQTKPANAAAGLDHTQALSSDAIPSIPRMPSPYPLPSSNAPASARTASVGAPYSHEPAPAVLPKISDEATNLQWPEFAPRAPIDGFDVEPPPVSDPPKPAALKGRALVSAMREANASEEEIVAALVAQCPP